MSSARLPAEWVERIFQKLTVRYGLSFTGRWQGIDPELVKADWAEQLGGFMREPKRIAYALDNLPPDKAPTVGQFAEIANRMVDHADSLRIDWKRDPIPANVAERLAAIKREVESKRYVLGGDDVER
jgi:hypothetical protein